MRLERFNPFTPFGWVFIIGTTLMMSALACSKQPEPAPAPEATPIVVVEPVDRGNGVYYFPVTGEQYIESLAKFYEGNGKHCDLQGITEQVVEVYPGYNTATRHTVTTGFILHCHDLAVEAQSVTVP